MAEANAAFLRGRADVYRSKANAAPGSPAVEEYLRLADLWEAEAAAAEAAQAKQPAPSILRRPAAPSPVLSIRRPPPPELMLKRA